MGLILCYGAQLTLFQAQLIKDCFERDQYEEFLSSCLLFQFSLRSFDLWMGFPLAEAIQEGHLLRLCVMFSMVFLYSSQRPYGGKPEQIQ